MAESPVGRMTHQGVKAHTTDGSAGRISQAGLVARSPEGTAAKGMQIKGNEDLWVEIQANTFRNWVNEHLRPVNMKVVDLVEDLKSGTHLCALVEQLQGKPLKPSWHPRPASRHHSLENVTAALRAIEADGVKLVNIGNVDIVNGNLKLILGLIWSLIVRYQIGRSKFPPRKLMLAWLQAVLPECRVTNLTTDWNSGILLSALVDYCRPGLFSHWRSLNPNDSIENCSHAMNIANRDLNIPRVLEPEYLASPWLDELSGMTYLSYFMKPDSPGFHATLRWVNSRLDKSVKNFTTDWNDGKAACEVIRSLGGSAPAPEKLKSDPSYWENNLQQAIDAGRRLGVQPILSAKDMSHREVEHLGVMAYAAHFQWVKPRPPLSDMIQVHLEHTSGRVDEPMNFRVDLLSKELDYSQIKAYVVTPAEQMHRVKLQNRGEGMFVPDKMGMHEIVLDVDDIRVDNRFFFRVLPRLVTVAPPGMAPCALGSLVEVLVNATGAPKREDILVTAYSPSGRPLHCPLQHVDDTSSAIFKPDEPGTWEIAITYQGKNIQGGPFTCDVFDPAGITVSGLEGATAHKAHYFHVDTSGCGIGIKGELNVDIVHDKRSVMCAVEKFDQHTYRVSFMPKDNGKHRIYVYFNGYDVKGSPFMMRVGSHKSKLSSSKPRESPIRMSSPVNKYRESSPFETSDYLKNKSYEDSNAYKSSYTDDYNVQKTTSGYDVTDSGYMSSKITTKTQEINSSSKFRSESPRNTTSSPITNKYLGDHRTDINRTSSPIYRTASPIGRTTSPVGRTASPINRTASPGFSPNKYGRDSPSTLTTRVAEKSNYRMHTSYNSSNLDDERNTSIGINRPFRNDSPSDNQAGVDHSSNIKVSSAKGSRRDSWDAIAKTRHLMSANSLESLANLADSQLNTDLSYGRSTTQNDSETRRNTQLNKFSAYSEENFNNQLDNLVGGYKSMDIKPKKDDVETDGFYTKEYQTSKSQFLNSSTSYTRRDINEDSGYSYNQHSFLSNKPPRESGGALNNNHSEPDATHQRFRSQQVSTSHSEKGGASSVHVQNIPNGLVGKPVEFEIDGSRAGSGNLEILVNGGRVTSSVRALGGQRFLAAFTPHQPADHTVQITFNGDTVPGSPWQVSVMSAGSSGGSISSTGASIVGEATRLVAARLPAVFEVLTAPGSAPFVKSEIGVNVIAPSKRLVPSRILDSPGKPSAFRIEFVPEEVGTHVIEVSIAGNKLSAGPLIAKVYDSSLIQVNDVSSGVVGQPCQFRVDASAAGEGQLEISINEGEVPNHVQVVGGGRCLVSFTPDQAKPHYIDIKFNGETVIGCPFVCNIADTSRVSLNLNNLELITVGTPSTFQLTVRGGGAAELAVAVRGPRGELPVRVMGDAHSGFTAEFTPHAVGPHTLTVDYNGHPVQGTPFVAKAYDARLVAVGGVSGGGAVSGGGIVGGTAHFTVDASQAGEGNLEITISARGLNIPTQVHPQGNARFSVSFVPAEACDHIVNVSFNKMIVPGCPIIVPVSGGLGGPQVSLPGPGPVMQATTLLINHPGGRLEDVEVNVEGPNGSSVPATVQQTGDGLFKAEFVPRIVGEHRINVMIQGQATPGSPFAAKVYDVNAIRVKEVTNGTVGKPVTFLVETSQAGPGNLEVTVNGGRVPTSAQAQGQHTYAISFTPRDPTPHTVDLRFNGQDVPGSPFQCHISSPARVVDVESLEKVSVGSACEFYVESSTTPIIEILGPARRPVGAQVIPTDEVEEDQFGTTPMANQKYKIRFTPIDVGDHSIEVRLSQGGHVEGSPFLLKAYSAERVSVTDITPGTVGKPVCFTINASQAGAGNLEIIVAVAGRNVPNYVQSEGNARFKVNFKPTEAAPHSLSVRFNGRAVPGSPFTCIVGPAGGNAPPNARARGPTLRSAPRGHNAEIQLAGFNGNEPQISVSAPGGVVIKPRIIQGPLSDNWTAKWLPEQVGRHQISITAGPSHHIQGSPFTCNVYDVDKVRVTGLGAGGLEGMVEGLSLGESIQGEVGKPVTFSVDAANAGEGTLELVVSTAQSTVKAEVVACARGLYDVTFVPQTCEPHFVNITFNEAAVPGSPFQCDVHETVNHVQIGGNATVDLPTSSHSVEIVGPDGKNVSYTTNHGVAEFKTDQIGLYNVKILNSSGSIISAKSVNVFDTNLIKVLSIGDAYCHRPAIITVSVAEVGAGVLTALVRCGGTSVPHSVRSQGTRHELVYHPSRAAPHTVMLFYNGVPVSRRPLRPNVLPPAIGQEVTASGLGLYQAKVGQVSTFSIDTLGRPAREFDVVVSGPGGIALPVRCYQTKSGQLQAEFTVSQVGLCTIEVLHLSKPVSGSPFTCHSFDPAKVSLSNIPQGNVSVHTPITFTVNHTDAGLAELDVTATSPLGHSLPLDITPQGEGIHHVQLLPTIPGHYRLYITYGGVGVAGSPLSLGVIGSGVGATPSTAARALGAGLQAAHVGKESTFTVISHDAQPHIQIEKLSSPEEQGSPGQLLDCVVAQSSNGEWRCTYIPLYVGLYEIRISCPRQGPLAGSPWELKVIDTSQVSLIGGWSLHLDDSGRVKIPAKLIFDTSNAGPGQLECLLNGRNVSVETVNNRAVVSLSPIEGSPEEMSLDLTYSGAVVGGAPRAAHMTPGSGNASAGPAERVLLAGRGLATAHTGEVAHFTIDGSQAGNGQPEVLLQSRSLSRAVGVALTRAGPALWRASYTAPSPGHYLLRVTWDNRLVKGCPLSVVVSGGADASLVTCSGVGLSQGVVGKEIRSWIDTRRAGPGELTAHCTGPHKVAYCELYEHGDATFTLNVKPQEAGRHQLTVKYAGEHVPGSPFQLRVAGAPDASKVRVYGPGVEAGVLATFQSRFICDTRGAGAGQLTVRVRGPKGAFRVEMQRESQKDRTILCKFDPTEPGDYRVEVKWAGKLVPGSPFPVMIFDTQEELRRYLQTGQIPT